MNPTCRNFKAMFFFFLCLRPSDLFTDTSKTPMSGAFHEGWFLHSTSLALNIHQTGLALAHISLCSRRRNASNLSPRSKKA